MDRKVRNLGYETILELQGLTGTLLKQSFIKQHIDNSYFKNFLYYTLNPLITYNLSEKTLRQKPDGKNKESCFSDIFDCCEQLSRLRGIDNFTVQNVLSLLQRYPDRERELYIKLLSKTLRLGLTAKTVNKIVPNLIPEWEVQQAYPIDKYPLSDGEHFWLTQKLNGVRATYYNGQLIARSGLPYSGVEHITSALAWADALGVVLDGELTLKNKKNLSDNEAFRAATGILNTESANKIQICYTIFDAVPYHDFESSNPVTKYSVRRALLSEFKTDKPEYVSVLPVLYEGTDQSKIPELLDQMVREDKEGLVVNTDVPYRRTRHRGILKVKRFYTMDLPIVRCEEGSGRLANTLGAFVLSYKGNEVKVGSGFTDEQREDFWNHRDGLTGILCEVKYKEVSYDKGTGLESLQFPIFVGLRTDKSEVSYG